jgi:hypothetical protein
MARSPAHTLIEDVDLERAQSAVRLRHSGDTDKEARLDVRQRRLHARGNARVRSKPQFQDRVVPGADNIDAISVHFVDCPAHAYGFLGEGLGHPRQERQQDEDRRGNRATL